MEKTVLITGGSRGIGRACAELFADIGFNVALSYNKNQDDASALVRTLLDMGVKSACYRYDACSASDARELAERVISDFGRLDTLILNAGVSECALAQDIDERMWHDMLGANLSGAFYLSRALIPHMVQKKSGSMVFMSSIWGLRGAAMEAHYAVSKSGIIGLMRSLARELGPSNIRVNAIAPGLIMTDMNRDLSESELERIKENTPLCRLGTPHDVARAARFLCSDEAAFITGQVLTVDGGLTV